MKMYSASSVIREMQMKNHKVILLPLIAMAKVRKVEEENRCWGWRAAKLSYRL